MIAAAAMVAIAGQVASAQDHKTTPTQPGTTQPGMNQPGTTQPGMNQPGQDTGGKPTTPDSRDASDFQQPSWQKGDKEKYDRMMTMEKPGEMQQWLRKYEGNWRVETVEGMGMARDGMNRDGMNRDGMNRDDASRGNMDNRDNNNTNRDSTNSNRDNMNRDNPNRDVNDKNRDKDTANKDMANKDMANRDMNKDRANGGMGMNRGGETLTARTEFKHGQHACTKVDGMKHGQMFEGAGTLAYDNVAKRFESTWQDSMHSGIAYMTGQLDSDKKVLTLTGECADPTTGKMTTKRSVTRWLSDDKYVQEIYGTEGDSSSGEKRIATMTFTRDGRSGMTAVPENMNNRDDGSMRRDNPR